MATERRPVDRATEDTSIREVRSFWSDVREIYAIMSRGRRRQMRMLVALMLCNAGAELGTIGAVLPLLSMMSHSEGLEHHSWALHFLHTLGRNSETGQLIAATAIFCAFALVAGALRFELASLTYRFGYDLAHELTLEIQRRILLQPYIFHVQHNTSTLVSTLEKANILVFEVLLPLTQAVSGAFIALFILAALLTIAPLTATAAAVIFCGIYAAVSRFTRASLAASSAVIAKAIDERLKIVQESLGGIRDVIIDRSRSAYLASFDRENGRLGAARANTAIIGVAPRFLIEAIGIVAIAVIALVASRRQGGLAAALPALGAIALGAQRLLPLIQQVYRGWTTASGHLSLVGQTVALLTLPVEEETDVVSGTPLSFRKQISFEGVSFIYPRRRSGVLQNVSLEIPVGSAVALTGETGSGKSTLADLLMGLLEPDEGTILIDGVPLSKENVRRWQQSIAHVAQSVFLTDSTIAQNISLSLPDLPADADRIVDAARKAQLHDFVVSLPGGYDTFVGERGIRLSGGQRQRLGIARAIYKGAPIFVLDEATSALDEETEAAVMTSLEQLKREGRTLIIIAHRLSTIRHCDVVFRLERGRVVEVGSFDKGIRAKGKVI